MGKRARARLRAAFESFKRGLRYVDARWPDGERARYVADLFCSCRYTGLGHTDGGYRTVEDQARYELRAPVLTSRVDPDALLASWALDETAWGLFAFLWVEDDRAMREAAQGFRRREVLRLRGDDAPLSSRKFAA